MQENQNNSKNQNNSIELKEKFRKTKIIQGNSEKS